MKKNFLFDLLLPRIEGVGYLVAILGLGLKWALRPGSDILLLLGLTTLATSYFVRVLAPATADNELATLTQGSLPMPKQGTTVLAEQVAPRVACLGASIVCIGTLFKLLSWPGAAPELLLGALTLGMAVLLLALAKRFSRQFALILGLGIGMLAISSETLIRQFHRNDPVLTQLLLYRLHHPHERVANEAVRQYLGTRRK